ncbi:MAG: regulatory protein RecX [Brooklawnia sp.]
MVADQAGVGPEVPEPPADPYAVTREMALRALERRAYGRAELGDRLRRKGAAEEVVEQVLNRFVEVGLLDDAAFAAMWVEQRHRLRKLPRRALVAELRRKGIDQEVIDEAVGVIDHDAEAEAAMQLAASRARSLARQPYEVALRRLVGALGRRGFGSQLAWQAARQALADREREDQGDGLDNE